ncbi:MAG: hypothetical protein ACR2G9_01965 [Gaiellaceae bacterium]
MATRSRSWISASRTRRTPCALALDPDAFIPGYNPVPPEIDRAVAEAALATLSTAELSS